MAEILSLSSPFFGLIFLGYLAARIVKIPIEGLAWLNTFILYFALPALFYRLIASTPIDQLTNWAYIFATSFSTYVAFALAFVVGIVVTRGNIPISTIQGVAGSYSNIGYMGPGITLAALGPPAAVPTALIFCFDNALLFTLVPFLMALGGDGAVNFKETALLVLKRVFFHPFILATIAGVIAAYFQFQPPTAVDRMLEFLAGAAAPCALFTMGVTVAMRPLKRIPGEMPVLLLIKLVIHPIVVVVMLGLVGVTDKIWITTAILMAALPPALNVFILAQQYDTYVERASSVILVGTVVSVFTVTGLLYLITNDLLPV
ncbi:MAG: AEC family transporter [Pseudomonadota bacterium]